MRTELIVIGTSWGGLRALQMLLRDLPPNLGCPVLVAQHRAADGESDLATVLGRASVLPVCDAADKDQLVGGRVYLAPADYHLMVEEKWCVALSTSAPVHSARPSIDVLFDTAAAAYGAAVAGVVLTGASADGASGLAAIQRAGGAVIVQDPSTAECPIMPQAAVAATRTPVVLPLEGIASHLARLTGGGVLS